MELSVVIPVLNEAGNIEPLLAEVVAALQGKFDFEIVYVDDASDDATPDELASARRRNPQLRVVTHRRTCGQSTALRSGIIAARGDWIATLDGDGQNDPADIPKLLEVARQAAAAGQTVLVAGYRKRRQDSNVKRLSSRVANAVRSRLLGDATPDTGCGLKVFARTDFLNLPYHKMILADEIPLSIGGGIGQSRTYQYLLRKAALGECSVTVWPEQLHNVCGKHNIKLLR
mgnify:CR=1 FL=1